MYLENEAMKNRYENRIEHYKPGLFVVILGIK